MELIKIIILITVSSILIGYGLNRLFRKKTDFSISLFQSYITGLIIIYLLVLLGIHLSILINGLLIFSVPATVYLAYFFYKEKSLKISPLILGLNLVFTIFAIYWSLDLLRSIIYEPIWAWDARSIWYFKAKQLYAANGLNETTGINSLFSMNHVHPEYPLMVPSLGALLAKYVGYWNEYLPKSNLIFLWIGVIFAFYSLKSMHIISKVILFISLIVISPFYLKIGYMDVWLGIYSSISILFLIEYSDSFKIEYLVSSFSCMIFCNYLKHDASLISVSILISYLGLMLFIRNRRFVRFTVLNIYKILPILGLLLFPFFIWIYYKIKWKISATDFDFKKLIEFSNYNNTFTKEKYDLIYKNFFEPIGFINILVTITIVVLVAILYAKYSKFALLVLKNGALNVSFPLVASIVFAAGMIIIYCLSIRDLSWHLSTSADRLRLDLVFISLPSLYGATKLFFYSTFEKNTIISKKNKKFSKAKKKS